MKEIIPRLYLGNSFDAISFPKDKEADIVAVVNTTWEVLNYHEKEGIEYLKLFLNEASSLTPKISKSVTSFIDKNRKRGGVLVHCNAGMQRSPAIIILYLTRIGYKLDEAYDTVKCKADYIIPPGKMIDFIEKTSKKRK